MTCITLCISWRMRWVSASCPQMRHSALSESRCPLTMPTRPACLTLYRIDRDFRAQVAGADEMGTLNHEHVDNEILARVQRDGRAGLWLMAIEEDAP